jgi:hypothetical protein
MIMKSLCRFAQIELMLLIGFKPPILQIDKRVINKVEIDLNLYQEMA